MVQWLSCPLSRLNQPQALARAETGAIAFTASRFRTLFFGKEQSGSETASALL
jgi:hypothetical protein